MGACSTTAQADDDDDLIDSEIRVALRLLDDCAAELAARDAAAPGVRPGSADDARQARARRFLAQVEQIAARLRTTASSPILVTRPLPRRDATGSLIDPACLPRLEIEIIEVGEDDPDESMDPWSARRRIVGTLPRQPGRSRHLGDSSR